MRPFSYSAPRTLQEAIDLLGKYDGKASVMAGGTDLLVQMKEGVRRPRQVIDLKNIPGMNQIRLQEPFLKIGALVTVHEVEISPLIGKYCPILSQAASLLGSFQIRNKGTIGGNLCNASPSADLAPPLIALGGRVILHGSKGERMEELENFFVAPGKTILNTDEVLTDIYIPVPSSKTTGCYLKLSPRKAMDLAVVGVAAVITVDCSRMICRKAAIALGAVAPTPMRAKQSERKLEGAKIEPELLREASKLASEEARPISDLRGSAWYRREMVRVLVGRSIQCSFEELSHPARTVR